MEWVAIGIGGFIGALGRSLIGGLVVTWFGQRAFPLATFSVNMLGCFVFGLLGVLVEERLALPVEMRGMLFVGFLGAFTTFSTFSVELLDLLRSGQLATGLFYSGASVVLGIGAVWLGMVVGQR